MAQTYDHAARKPNGEHCSTGAQCISDYCHMQGEDPSMYKCAAPTPTGGGCTGAACCDASTAWRGGKCVATYGGCVGACEAERGDFWKFTYVKKEVSCIVLRALCSHPSTEGQSVLGGYRFELGRPRMLTLGTLS